MNISILGGGIGGLSTAIALRQEGFDVSIYERHSRPSEIGAGIVCWPNASFILEQLGVLNEISNVSGSINYMNRFTNTGEPIGSLNINELNRLMKYPSYSIIRKDLMKILIQRTIELNISIHYDHEVIKISNGNGNTEVQFSNSKVIQPDIIIGADGRMKSLARKYVNGSNSPIYQGFINWVGVIEDESINFSELSVSDYWGVGERFGIVPVSRTKAYWAGGATSNNIAALNPVNYKSELSSIFSDWPDIITKIINGTPQSRINKIYVHDHDPINLWHKNNLVLLGDSAHSPLPTSGQGACQALEDAWHLTNCIKEYPNNLNKAFNLFTELRKSKTAGITFSGRQLASSIFNTDEEFCKQRNIASKNTNYQNTVVGMANAWSSGLPISA
ncbi:FAD-dependent monooxygenase [Saccharophagus degradans]|uniref:FAD-dependent monooxygenase n=1 Tax=Saccharophagus degradans TaxID=86304 RepID=UPI001C095336|nr:FAD-dependent monooxygenase [Saccharophagus degradans]MBU2983731.1 FAD-dependent monooxygenase [Saccharophagus degradans]